MLLLAIFFYIAMIRTLVLAFGMTLAFVFALSVLALVFTIGTLALVLAFGMALAFMFALSVLALVLTIGTLALVLAFGMALAFMFAFSVLALVLAIGALAFGLAFSMTLAFVLAIGTLTLVLSVSMALAFMFAFSMLAFVLTSSLTLAFMLSVSVLAFVFAIGTLALVLSVNMLAFVLSISVTTGATIFAACRQFLTCSRISLHGISIITHFADFFAQLVRICFLGIIIDCDLRRTGIIGVVFHTFEERNILFETVGTLLAFQRSVGLNGNCLHLSVSTQGHYGHQGQQDEFFHFFCLLIIDFLIQKNVATDCQSA